MVGDQLQLLYGIAMDRGQLAYDLSGIASSPARAFTCTLDQENYSSFTGVSCRDPAFFPATKEVSHQDQKGNFPEHLSKSVKKADAHNSKSSAL